MGFLEAYTALSSADARRALLTDWVFHRRQALFAELREQSPIFETPDFVLVARYEDVKAIFQDANNFTVKAYVNSEDFVLGKDKEDGHDEDRAFLTGLMPNAELERVHIIAAAAIKNILDLLTSRHTHGNPSGHRSRRESAGRIDLPTGFARQVSIAIAQNYFGLPDPAPQQFGRPELPPQKGGVQFPDPRPFTDPTFPCVGNWITVLNGAFIHGAFGRHFEYDSAAVQALVARVPQVRKELAAHVATVIEGLCRSQPPASQETILARMVRAREVCAAITHKQEGLRELIEKITRDLVGMINGMVDNVTAAVCNTMDFFLSHPSVRKAATAVARTVIPPGQPGATSPENQARRKRLWQMIREALRFNAPVPFLLRIARDEWHSPTDRITTATIPEGKIVFLAVCSAMMDEKIFAQPTEFRPDRDLAADDDLIFGTGWHDCFGKYVAQAQILEMIRALLVLPGLRRAPGPRGTLEYDGFFARKFAVDFGPEPVQQALTAVMTIKPGEHNVRALKLLLSLAYQQVVDVLDQVGTVHFARFVFLENDTKLALVTTYDGSFETYIHNYIEVAGDLFDLMLKHIEDAPPLPVRRYRKEFIEYVRKVDITSDSQFYSAYPRLTVQNILFLEEHDG